METKVKCSCGCPTTLYVTSWDKDSICIGSEKDGRKSFKKFKGIVIDKKELIKLIKQC